MGKRFAIVIGVAAAGVMALGAQAADAYVYWANYGTDTIGRADLDGTNVNRSFITGAEDPLGVAVDAGHVYWANTATSSIGRADLDGTDVNRASSVAPITPGGVAVDANHVYWVNRGSSRLGLDRPRQPRRHRRQPELHHLRHPPAGRRA